MKNIITQLPAEAIKKHVFAKPSCKYKRSIDFNELHLIYSDTVHYLLELGELKSRP